MVSRSVEEDIDLEQAVVHSVTDVNQMIKHCLERPEFMGLFVQGEIFNFKHHSSGHMYFTLKDESSRLRAVMFRSMNRNLAFRPKNGDIVIALGSIGVYEPNGEYQIYVEELIPQGDGLLHWRFQQLKDKLAAEGLFNPRLKKKLPFLPRRIAVITSPTGAAVRDIISVITRRFPGAWITVVPALVQGSDASRSLISALRKAEKLAELDVAIIARGGGSLEELWPFNDEELARAIASFPLPIVSAVGHETDFTIADFAADIRAATPSAAAELVVPDKDQLVAYVRKIGSRLTEQTKARVVRRQQNLNMLLRGLTSRRFLEINRQQRQKVDDLVNRASMLVNHRREIYQQRLASLAGRLNSLSPLATLERGYAVCQKIDGRIITSFDQVTTGEPISVRLRRGTIDCLVKGVDCRDR